jgi:hypothetical protein
MTATEGWLLAAAIVAAVAVVAHLAGLRSPAPLGVAALGAALTAAAVGMVALALTPSLNGTATRDIAATVNGLAQDLRLPADLEERQP